MPHTLVDIEFRLLARRLQLLKEPDAGTQENALRAVDDERRREALAEVRIQGRDAGIGQVEPVGIGQGAILQRRNVAEHGVCSFKRVGRIPGVADVYPWRPEHDGRRHAHAAVAEIEHGGDRQTAPGGVAV